MFALPFLPRTWLGFHLTNLAKRAVGRAVGEVVSHTHSHSTADNERLPDLLNNLAFISFISSGSRHLHTTT